MHMFFIYIFLTSIGSVHVAKTGNERKNWFGHKKPYLFHVMHEGFVTFFEFQMDANQYGHTMGIG